MKKQCISNQLTFSEKIKYCFPTNLVFKIIIQLIMLL